MPKLFIAALLLFSNNLFAQKLQLTNEHYFKGKLAQLIKPLPTISFSSEPHKAIIKIGEEYNLLDLKKGTQQTVSKPEQKNNAAPKADRIITKNNNLFFNDKQLTFDNDKEVNPLLNKSKSHVAYTKNNDLYIADVNTAKETRITNDGSSTILNGYASWVYYEEILGRQSQYRSFWWNENGNEICFFKSDDTKVPLFRITDASGRNGKDESLYYPKVGDANPEIKIGIYNINSNKTIWADFNEKDDQYFGKPYFTPDAEKLFVPWLNRDQTDYKLYDVDLKTGQKKLIYTEQQKTWISLDDDDRIKFIPNTKEFIFMSDKTGWRHMYRMDYNGKLLNPITSGNFTVLDLIKFDEKNKRIFFTGRGYTNSANIDLFVVNYDGKNFKKLTNGDYNFSQFDFSDDNNYFITTYSSYNTPPQRAIYSTKGKLIKTYGEGNDAELQKYEYAKTEFIRVPSEDGKFQLPMRVIYPLNMDKSKKYPVLISIYGGPDAGTCWNRWQLTGEQQFYAKEGLIQVVMDHRASGHFGKQGVDYMHRNLGYWETKDYSTMVKWLIENGNADKDKICITGFSYGGYLSCYTLCFAPDVFTHGMAGGPVTDWTLYDSHYTERYMDTDKDNPEGYKSSSVLTHAKNLKGKLQIAHGEIDENVHLQNSLQLAKALQNAKKDFDFMVYPTARHGWIGAQWDHYLNAKTKFIYQYLLEKPVNANALK